MPVFTFCIIFINILVLYDSKNARHLQFDTCNMIERFLYCLKEAELGAIFLGLEADGYWPLLSFETELGGALPKCKADGNDLCYPGKQECGWTLPKCKVMFLKTQPVTSFGKFVRLLLIKGVDTRVVWFHVLRRTSGPGFRYFRKFAGTSGFCSR